MEGTRNRKEIECASIFCCPAARRPTDINRNLVGFYTEKDLLECPYLQSDRLIYQSFVSRLIQQEKTLILRWLPSWQETSEH